jgi:hypothetical protein
VHSNTDIKQTDLFSFDVLELHSCRLRPQAKPDTNCGGRTVPLEFVGDCHHFEGRVVELK